MFCVEIVKRSVGPLFEKPMRKKKCRLFCSGRRVPFFCSLLLNDCINDRTCTPAIIFLLPLACFAEPRTQPKQSHKVPQRVPFDSCAPSARCEHLLRFVSALYVPSVQACENVVDVISMDDSRPSAPILMELCEGTLEDAIYMGNPFGCTLPDILR